MPPPKGAEMRLAVSKSMPVTSQNAPATDWAQFHPRSRNSSAAFSECLLMFFTSGSIISPFRRSSTA